VSEPSTLLVLRQHRYVAARHSELQSVLGVIQDVLGLQYHGLISRALADVLSVGFLLEVRAMPRLQPTCPTRGYTVMNQTLGFA
jgi:hypothetical protein